MLFDDTDPKSMSRGILCPAGRGIVEFTELGLLFDACDGTLATAFESVVPCFDSRDNLDKMQEMC